MTSRSQRAAVTSRIRGWLKVTWPPRSASARGEASTTPERPEDRLPRGDRVRRERDRLRPDGLDAHRRDERDHVLHREHADDGRRTGDEATDAGGRRVRRAHQERVDRAEPALDRLRQGLQVARRDVAERRRAGAAVEVLVGAPDREVGAPRVQRHRHRAGRVAEVPEHERARFVRDGRQGWSVGQPGRAVGDVRQHDECGRRPDGRSQQDGVTPPSRGTSIQRSVSPHSSATPAAT